MNISEALQATPPAPATPSRRQEHPTGREFEWNGSTGWLKTEPLEDRPKTWDAFIADALGPDMVDQVEVIEPVQVRGWDMPTRVIDPDTNLPVTSVVRAHYYRIILRRRALVADIEELVKLAKRRARGTANAVPVTNDQAFVLALGDLQLGKMDGDGAEGTVARYLQATADAVKRYRLVAKGAPVYLIHLGDCIEGFVSQGGANAQRTLLTTTEQVRLYRRLLFEQLEAFAKAAPDVTVVGIPGNHDEAHRPIHTYGDSWAIDAVSSVHDALEFAGGWEHVNVFAPARDELTVTLNIAGTVVGMAHGHQWRPGQACAWWAKQAHGRQPIGDADVLLSAHLHHLRVESTGSDKTWIQVPALESGSQWWKHRTGEWGQPGIVTMLVGGGSWSSLEILTGASA
jgi:predicted phosphodiesterase